MKGTFLSTKANLSMTGPLKTKHTTKLFQSKPLNQFTLDKFTKLLAAVHVSRLQKLASKHGPTLQLATAVNGAQIRCCTTSILRDERGLYSQDSKNDYNIGK